MQQPSFPPNIPMQPIPVAPLEKGVQGMQYKPVRYQQQPPPPLPPVTDPLPQIKRAQRQEDTKMKQHQKDQQLKAKKKQKKSFFGSMVSALESAAHEVDKGITKVGNTIDQGVRKEMYDAGESRFRRVFRFPYIERLWSDFSCRIINENIYVIGTLFISDNYVCFTGDKNGRRLAIVLPLKNIVSIQKATTLRATSSQLAPVIQTCTNKQMKPDAMELYTRDGTLHVFYSFMSYKDAYNVLDHAWRNCFYNPTAPPYPVPLNQSLGQPPPREQRIPNYYQMQQNSNTNVPYANPQSQYGNPHQQNQYQSPPNQYQSPPNQYQSPPNQYQHNNSQQNMQYQSSNSQQNMQYQQQPPQNYNQHQQQPPQNYNQQQNQQH